MRADEVVTYGITDPNGAMLWWKLRSRNPSHHEILTEMRMEQELLAAYSKGRTGCDDNQALMLRRIRLLETFAWRVYMFGSESTALYPGRMGELRKRQRMDPKYWKYLEESNRRHGTIGCEQLNNLFRRSKSCGKCRTVVFCELHMKACVIPKCTHHGQKYADKWLKSSMRQDWEREMKRRGYFY